MVYAKIKVKTPAGRSFVMQVICESPKAYEEYKTFICEECEGYEEHDEIIDEFVDYKYGTVTVLPEDFEY